MLGIGSFICKFILSLCIFIQINQTSKANLQNVNIRSSGRNSNEEATGKNLNKIPLGKLNSEFNNNPKNPFKTPSKENQIDV